jgi:hypothetical protein
VTLLPIAQRVNADAQRFRELFLRQAGKATERSEVPLWIDLAADDPLALSPRYGSSEIRLRQFAYVVTH